MGTDRPGDSAAEESSRPVGWLAWLDDLDWLLYAALGLVMLAGFFYEFGSLIFSSGSPTSVAAFIAFLAGTSAAVVRDVRRRQFGWVSRSLLVAWGLCVAFLLVSDITS